ncbi:hypothetical protein [Mangrovicoccus ximenensis]|uniref:hypothetical protein n=1 Tax=Mangrovicoccus ximenensis TaxID=1911570 RepID=UPI000D341961|nr:hypothetical protein [Mangrovicoccus ximenensis]
MSLTTTLPPDVQWFTWSDRPAEAVFGPLGLRITPLLYSTRARKMSRIEPRRDPVRLGHHALTACRTGLETGLAGTWLALALDPAGPFVQRGSWRQEAGLRPGRAAAAGRSRAWASPALS